MPNPSPMRYPGGKHRITGFIRLAIQKLNMPECTYVEPFAGGAGVALSLLLDGTVNRIVINDYDKAIYSFWRAVKQESTSLIDLIQNTPITMDEWYKQKNIFHFDCLLTQSCFRNTISQQDKPFRNSEYGPHWRIRTRW